MVINIRGYDVLIDDDVAELIKGYNWQVTKQLYFNAYVKGSGRLNKRMVILHRLIMNPPENMMVDHINGNVLDNRRTNLRICSNEDNVRNSRIFNTNTSGHRGVRYEANAYRARIRYNGKLLSIGRYKTFEEAALAYENKARELFGEYYRDPETYFHEIEYHPEKNKVRLYKGYSHNKRSNKYQAKIMVNKKYITLGTFDTPNEAHMAYLQAKENFAPK